MEICRSWWEHQSLLCIRELSLWECEVWREERSQRCLLSQVGHLSKVGIYHLGHLSVYILGVNRVRCQNAKGEKLWNIGKVGKHHLLPSPLDKAGTISPSLTPSASSVIVGGSLVAKSNPTLCNPMDYSLPGSSVHGVFQARILEWVAISSRASSQPRDQTCVSCIGRWILCH